MRVPSWTAAMTRDDCVEVGCSRTGHVGVRDSKLGTASPVLAIPAPQWSQIGRAHV